MTRPTIDILLAVYNGARYLRPFLDSLAAQSYSDFRLIVSNNRSSDATVGILDDYRLRFARPILVLPPPDTILPACFNFARVTEAGDANYIMYADGDDVWHKDKVEKTLLAMKSAECRYGTSVPLLVHSDLKVVDEDLRCLHPSFWRYQFINPDRIELQHLVLQNCVTGCTVMLNRPLFDLGRPLHPDACVHDHWFALVASAFGQIVAVREPLVDYRQHGGNVTGAKEWSARYVVERAWRLYRPSGGRENIARNVKQAQAFFSRFERGLSPMQKRLVWEFSKLNEQGVLERRRTLIRNGYWKTGFFRNVGLLFAV